MTEHDERPGLPEHAEPGEREERPEQQHHEHTAERGEAHSAVGDDVPRHPAPQEDGAHVSTGIETAGVPEAAIPELVIISGMSGAGRSTAAKCLEDLGWFVVDNLPPALIPTMVELGARSQGNVARIAVVVDVRGRRFFDNLRDSLADLLS